MSRTIYSGCTRPLRAFPVGIKDNGKTEYKITNYNCDHLEKDPSGIWREVGVKDVRYCGSPIVRDYLELACGVCPSCKLQKARQWSHRCVAESMSHESNYFITLTYDDLCLPAGGYAPSLRKSDLQKFWKRLRSEGFVFRYFACGEYGSHTLRPHYHAIVFGLELPDEDLIPYKVTEDGELFNSQTLERIWSHGFVVVGKVTEKSCNYVARYTVKKSSSDMQKFYDEFEVEPEFITMSRRPGIGHDWFLKHGLVMYHNQWYSYKGENGGCRLYPTKYFTSLLEDLDPEYFEAYKASQKDFSILRKDSIFRDDKRDFRDVLRDQEEQRDLQTKILKERSSCDA